MKALFAALLAFGSVSAFAGAFTCVCQVYKIKSGQDQAELVLKSKIVKHYSSVNEYAMITPSEDCVSYRGRRYFAKNEHNKVASCSLISLTQEEIDLLKK